MKNTNSSAKLLTLKYMMKGFTLIELLIVLVMVTILMAVAYPSYTRYMERACRAEAKNALLAAAQFMERFASQNNGTMTGSSLPPSLQASGQTPSKPGFTIALALTAADPVAYTLTATRANCPAPEVNGCTSPLTIVHTGLKSTVDGTADMTRRCWVE